MKYLKVSIIILSFIYQLFGNNFCLNYYSDKNPSIKPIFEVDTILNEIHIKLKSTFLKDDSLFVEYEIRNLSTNNIYFSNSLNSIRGVRNDHFNDYDIVLGDKSITVFSPIVLSKLKPKRQISGIFHLRYKQLNSIKFVFPFISGDETLRKYLKFNPNQKLKKRMNTKNDIFLVCGEEMEITLERKNNYKPLIVYFPKP